MIYPSVLECIFVLMLFFIWRKVENEGYSDDPKIELYFIRRIGCDINLYNRLMEQSEHNKKYIRDHIPDRFQNQFYEYFLRLPDQDQFHQWSLPRTIEVVSEFLKICQASHQESETVKQLKTSEKNQKNDLTNSSALDQKSTEGVRRRTASSEKRTSAISLLDEIEQSFVNTPQKIHAKTSHNWNNHKQTDIWSSFQPPQKTSKREKVKDPFENFDSFITSPSKKQVDEKAKQGMNAASQSEDFIVLKRSQEIKKQQLSKKPSQIKTAEDKMFKYKLQDQLPCRQLPAFEEKPTVKVNNHEIVHRTLLPDYAIYHISVSPQNIICKRTYDDFLELRKILDKLFPGCKVPVIDSASWFSESDIALINTNKVTLEQFLNDILSHPTLSKAEVFRDFLSVSDQKKMERTLENYLDIPISSRFSQLSNSEGLLKFNLSEQNFKIINSLPKWKKVYSNYYDRYIDLVSTLISQYVAISETFGQMITLSSDFQMNIGKSQRIASVLNRPEEISELLSKEISFFKGEKRRYETDINNLKDRYLSILKYERLNINSFETTIEEVHSLTEKYIKRLENEPESPSSDLYSSQIAGRTKHFQSDLWHEPASTSLFKYQVAYLHNKLIEQSHIFNQQLVHNLNSVWQTVFTKREPSSPRNSA